MLIHKHYQECEPVMLPVTVRLSCKHSPYGTTKIGYTHTSTPLKLCKVECCNENELDNYYSRLRELSGEHWIT